MKLQIKLLEHTKQVEIFPFDDILGISHISISVHKDKECCDPCHLNEWNQAKVNWPDCGSRDSYFTWSFANALDIAYQIAAMLDAEFEIQQIQKNLVPKHYTEIKWEIN